MCATGRLPMIVFHSLSRVSFEQGWTDVMYALMDAEVNAVAAIFSVSVIVVIAFLGIQLFTSALCTSSMQVRWVVARCLFLEFRALFVTGGLFWRPVAAALRKQ